MSFNDPAILLEAVAACYCANLALTLGGPPAVCCVAVSEPVVPDCCQGVAWVRPLNIYPVSTFPSPLSTPVRCQLNIFAMTLELGIQRCAPKPCDPLKAACCDAELDATRVAFSDYAAMRNTFLCCMTGSGGLLMPDDVVFGEWAVDEPLGGCYGSRMAVTVRWAL